MTVTIKNRWTQVVLFEVEAETIREACEKASALKTHLEGADLKGADLKGADLKGAYLEGADLKGAYLEGAYLKGADLKGAYLEGADLEGADLEGAYLEGAYLEGADLKGAYLEGADLKGADLKGAYLEGAYLKGADLKDSTILPTGETWGQYQKEVVPALLTAGGKPLAEVVAAGWECHDWNNCPMAVAFGVHTLQEVPVLFRPRAEQFIKFFDSGLLKKPETV